MAAHLLIRDGSPQWWLSPDVWVVPGNDPNGAPGTPVAGEPAFLWAHVANSGDFAANGTRIDFYWADPSMQIVVGSATQIGSAFADIPAGASQDVLCLVSWTPSFVNGGHECILAVAHSSAEAPPLPDPLPGGFDFAPPAHDEIAQRNLSVADGATAPPFPLTITGSMRVDLEVLVTTEFGGELDDRLLAQLGLGGFRPAHGEAAIVDLRREASCHRQERQHCSREIKILVPRGTSTGIYVTIQPHSLEKNHYQLVHVTERSGDRLLGGITYVAINSRKGDTA